MVITAQDTQQKPGYKQTEVGEIPEDWSMGILEDVCVPGGLVRGPFGGAIKKEFFVNDGFKVYEQRNAIYRDANLGFYFISENKYKELKRFEIKEGEFIVSCAGTIGKIFQIPKEAKAGVINQALLKIKTDSRVIHDQFFFYVFDWDKFQQRIIDNTQGGAMQNLVGMDIFRNILIPLPPLPEQQAIATVLSDIDALIASLDKLIAKKRDIKRAAMQQLLTGKTRLPGFSGEWELQVLGEIAKIIDPHPSHRAPPLKDDGIPFVGIGDISTDGKINYQTSRIVSEMIFEQHNERYNLEQDLIGIGRVASIGKVVRLLPNVGKFVVSPTIAVIKPQKIDIDLLFYCLTSKEVKEQFDRISNGSTRQSVGMNVLRDIQLFLPRSLVEQQAIATILCDMDTEIVALEQRRDKTRALKQGMMQELLTGKTRLL